jgi:putative two-component system response regulator
VAARHTILIADDAQSSREALRGILADHYDLLEACDVEGAIRLLSDRWNDIALVFLDLVMPKGSGLDVLRFMRGQGLLERIPVVVITGMPAEAIDEQIYTLGATDILYKPFAPMVVLHRAQNTIELFQHKLSLEEQLAERTHDLMESKRIIEQSNEFLINALSSVVEFRSLESGEHIHRVKRLTRLLLQCIQENYPEYQLSDDQVRMISDASALHDVGKIAIPDSILLKPGRLTDAEFEEMKKHTIYGCSLLEKFKQADNEFYRYCYDICRHHHERYDGKGYPDGLVGEQIPIWAQVVSIADAYDALVNDRVYKPPYPPKTAVRMIETGECGAFSPKILACFRMARPKLMASA